MTSAEVARALEAVASVKQATDTVALRRQVAHVQNAAMRTGQLLPEQILADLRAGFNALGAAVEANNRDRQRNELNKAQGSFNRLATMAAGRTVAGIPATISSDQVKALSHWGNYYCFIFRDDPRQALMEAYRCTEAYPFLGIRVFPAELFSRNYRLLELVIGQAQPEIGQVQPERTWPKKVWSIAKPIGKTAGIFAAGVLASPFSPHLATHAFKHGAISVFESASELKELREGFTSSPRAVLSASFWDKWLAEQVVAECRERRQQIEA
jgi:hypothetical protein